MALATRASSRRVPRGRQRVRTAGLAGAWVAVGLVSVLATPARSTCPASCAAPASWGQPFAFAGLTWERKSGCGGPGPNCWAWENATLVAGDGVHLKLTRVAGHWYAAEIRTAVPVAYGDYSVRVVGRTDLLDA